MLIWLPYRLIARSPRRWWLYCALALIPFAFLALVVLPVCVAPLTTAYKPLDDRPLETRIEALAARCGVASIPIFVAGNDTSVVGLGPTNRILLQSNLASVEMPDQIEFTIGHELKHYVMGDNWKALAIIAAILLAGFWLTDRLGRWAIRRFSGRWGFSELRDPASLPMIVFMFAFLWLAILPFFNLFARHIELEADCFGLESTHQNHAAAMVCVRDAQSDLAPDWDTFFLSFEATHPSIATRIKFANSYKPWERGVCRWCTAMSANLNDQGWRSWTYSGRTVNLAQRPLHSSAMLPSARSMKLAALAGKPQAAPRLQLPVLEQEVARRRPGSTAHFQIQMSIIGQLERGAGYCPRFIVTLLFQVSSKRVQPGTGRLGPPTASGAAWKCPPPYSRGLS